MVTVGRTAAGQRLYRLAAQSTSAGIGVGSDTKQGRHCNISEAHDLRPVSGSNLTLLDRPLLLAHGSVLCVLSSTGACGAPPAALLQLAYVIQSSTRRASSSVTEQDSKLFSQQSVSRYCTQARQHSNAHLVPRAFRRMDPCRPTLGQGLELHRCIALRPSGMQCVLLQAQSGWRHESESDYNYISSSHIRLISCLAVNGQASCTRKHLF